MMTSRAEMSAFTLPLGPTVQEALPRSSLPSSVPSTNRSSFPMISPLMRMPWVTHATARGETGKGEPTAGTGAGLTVLDCGTAALGGITGSSAPWDLGSSFLHIRHLKTEVGFSKSAVVRAGGRRDLGKFKIVQGLMHVKGCRAGKVRDSHFYRRSDKAYARSPATVY